MPSSDVGTVLNYSSYVLNNQQYIYYNEKCIETKNPTGVPTVQALVLLNKNIKSGWFGNIGLIF